MVGEFKKPKEHMLKFMDHIEYAKSGKYLNQVDQEIEILTERLEFLNKQRKAAVKYRLKSRSS